MKPPHSITAEPAGTSLAQMARWPLTLSQLHARLRALFARPEPYQLALLYWQAVLSEIPRKNGWQIAEHARQVRPYGMQRLLSRAVWDQDGVRDELRALLKETLQPPPVLPASAEPDELFPVLALDESAIPKRGKHSAGVGPQYCGLTGRVENCQVGVFLSYVTARGHGLIDRELYLPEDWCQDAARRQAVHSPETVRFATKPELALCMVQRAQAAGLPIRWVVADTVYGHSTDLRRWLEEQGYSYGLERRSRKGMDEFDRESRRWLAQEKRPSQEKEDATTTLAPTSRTFPTRREDCEKDKESQIIYLSASTPT